MYDYDSVYNVKSDRFESNEYLWTNTAANTVVDNEIKDLLCSAISLFEGSCEDVRVGDKFTISGPYVLAGKPTFGVVGGAIEVVITQAHLNEAHGDEDCDEDQDKGK